MAVSPSASATPGLAFGYRDPKGHYIVHFPAAWDQEQTLGGIDIKTPGHLALTGIHYTKTDETLQQFAKRGPNIEAGTLSNFHLLSTKKTTVDGVPAVRFDYTGKNSSGVALRGFAVYTVTNGMEYRFSFVTSTGNYDQLAPTAEAILDSIHFT